MKLRQVIDVRSHLRHLDHSLVLDNALAHGRGVGVRDRDHIHQVVVTLLGALAAVLRGVLVVHVRVVTDDVFQQPQLLLQCVVHAGLHGGQDFKLALQQCQRGAHRSLRRHVGHLHIRSRSKPTALIHDGAQQLVQHVGRLFIWQRQDVVADVATAQVHVAELAGSNRGVVALNAQPTGLQTARKIAQGTGIDQLSHQGSRRLRKATDQVEQTEAICTEAGDVLVVDEVLTLLVIVVVLLPVAADSQNLIGALDERHHVRQRNLRVVRAELVALDHQTGVALGKLEAVVVDVREACLFVLGLLDVILVLARLAKLHVTIKASFLQTHDVVFGLAHQVRDAVACV